MLGWGGREGGREGRLLVEAIFVTTWDLNIAFTWGLTTSTTSSPAHTKVVVVVPLLQWR